MNYYQQGYQQVPQQILNHQIPNNQNQQNYNQHYNKQNQQGQTTTKYYQKIIKYPFQVYNVGRTDKVFSADIKLYAKKEGDMPLMLFNEFSTLTLNITGKQKGINANISISEIPILYNKSLFFFNKKLENLFNKKEKPIDNTTNSVDNVLNIKLTAGVFKNKMFGEIIGEADWDSRLRQHYDFLYKNLQKYPKKQDRYR